MPASPNSHASAISTAVKMPEFYNLTIFVGFVSSCMANTSWSGALLAKKYDRAPSNACETNHYHIWIRVCDNYQLEQWFAYTWTLTEMVR